MKQTYIWMWKRVDDGYHCNTICPVNIVNDCNINIRRLHIIHERNIAERLDLFNRQKDKAGPCELNTSIVY